VCGISVLTHSRPLCDVLAAEFMVFICFLIRFIWYATFVLSVLDICPIMREHILFPWYGSAIPHMGNNSLRWLQSSFGDRTICRGLWPYLPFV